MNNTRQRTEDHARAAARGGVANVGSLRRSRPINTPDAFGPGTFTDFLERLHRLPPDSDQRWDLIAPGTWLGELVAREAGNFHERRRVPERLDWFCASVRRAVHESVLRRLVTKLRRGDSVNAGYVAMCVAFACRDVAADPDGRTRPREVPISASVEGREAEVEDRGEPPDEVAGQKELEERFYAAVGQLDEFARDVLLLLWTETGGNRAEAARRLGVSRDIVCRVLDKAVPKLRRAFKASLPI